MRGIIGHKVLKVKKEGWGGFISLAKKAAIC